MSSARYLALQKMWETYDDVISSLSGLTEDVRNLCWCHQLAIWPYRRCEKPMMMSSARYLALQKMWETYADVISSLSGLTEDVRNLWWCHQLAIWPYRRCEKPMMMSSARYLALQKMWETYADVISSLSGLTEDVRNLWWCHSSLSDLTEDVRNLWWCHQLGIWPYRRCEKPMLMSSARYLALQMWETYDDVISSLSGLTEDVRNLWWCHQLAIWPYRRCEKPMMMSSARYLALQKMWETYDDVSLSDLMSSELCHQLAWPYRRCEKPMMMSSARLSGLTEDVRNLWWCHQLAIWPYRRCEKPMMMSSARYLALQKMWETYDDVISSLSGLTEDVRNLWWCHQLAIWPYRRCEKPMMMSSARYLALQKMWETYDDVISSLSGLTEDVRNLWWCHQLAIWPYRRCEKPMMMSSARYLALQKMWETYDDVISSLSGLTEDVRNLWWCHQLAIWPYRRCEKPMMMSSARYLALQKMWETYDDVISSLSGLTEDVRNLWWCHQLAIWPYRRCEKPMMMSSARYLALQKMWETYDDISYLAWRCVISSLSGLTEDVRNLWWCHQLAIWPYRRCEKPMLMSSARYLALQKMWETYDDVISSLSGLTEDVRNLWWCHQLAIWPYRRCEKPMMMSSARYLALQKMWETYDDVISSKMYLALQKMWETYDDVISSLSGLTEDVRNLWWCHQLAIWPYRRCEKPMMMSSARYLTLQKMWETYADVISSLSGLTEDVRNLCWCHQLAIWPYRRCEKPMMMSSARYLALQKMWETYADVISSLSGLTEDVRNLWWCHQLAIWPYRRCEKPMMMSQLAIWPYRRCKKPMMMSSAGYLALQKMGETYGDVISSLSGLTEDVRNLSWCHQLAIWPYRRCEKPMMMPSARYLALQKMWETYDDVISSLSGLTEDVRNLWWCHQLAIWPYRRCEKPMMMSSARYLALQKMWETYDDVISSLSGLTEDGRNLWWCHQLAIWPYRRCEKPMMMSSARYLALQKMWETYADVISSLSDLTEEKPMWCHQLAIWPYRRCEKPMMMSSARYLALQKRNLWWWSSLSGPYRRCEKPMMMSSARYLALQKMWETYDDVILGIWQTEDVRNLCWCHQLAIWPYEDGRNLWWCHQLAIWPYRRCEKPMMMSSARYLALQKMWETYADVISSLSGLTVDVRNLWWCHQLAIWPYRRCEKHMLMSSARYLALQKMWETYDDVISSLSGLTEDVRNLWWCHQLGIWPTEDVWWCHSSLSDLTEDVRNLWWCHQLAIWPYRRCEKPMMMSSARYLALQKMWETYHVVISSLSGLTEEVRNVWWCHQLAIWPYRRCEKPMMMSSARYLALQKMWETYDDVISSLSGLTEDVRNQWWCHQLAIWPNRRCEKPMMMSSARYLDLQKMWETYDDVISSLSGLTEDVRNLWWCHQLAIWPYEDGRNLRWCHQLGIWPYRRCEKPMIMSSARYLALQKMWETYDDVISSLSGLTEDGRNLWWCQQLGIWPYRRCEKPMMMSSARYLALQKMWETYADVISSLSGLTSSETYVSLA